MGRRPSAAYILNFAVLLLGRLTCVLEYPKNCFRLFAFMSFYRVKNTRLSAPLRAETIFTDILVLAFVKRMFQHFFSPGVFCHAIYFVM